MCLPNLQTLLPCEEEYDGVTNEETQKMKRFGTRDVIVCSMTTTRRHVAFALLEQVYVLH